MTQLTQLTKIEKHLRKNSTEGVTVAKLSKLSGVPKTSVYKRIHDLRVNEGKKIVSNYRIVNGERKLYYKIAS